MVEKFYCLKSVLRFSANLEYYNNSQKKFQNYQYNYLEKINTFKQIAKHVFLVAQKPIEITCSCTVFKLKKLYIYSTLHALLGNRLKFRAKRLW